MSYADFGSGILDVLGRARSMQQNADYNDYRNKMAGLSEERLRLEEEQQAGILEGQRLANSKSRREELIRNKEDSATLFWTDLESRPGGAFEGQWVTRGTNGATYNFDVDGILAQPQAELVNLMNADFEFNVGMDRQGSLIENEITGFQYVDKTGQRTDLANASGVVLNNKRIDGSSEGPMTINTTPDGGDEVDIIPITKFKEMTTNLLRDSYVIGRYNQNKQVEDMNALGDAIVRKITKSEAQANVDPSRDPGLYRSLIGDINRLNGAELDAYTAELSDDFDPKEVRRIATGIAKGEFDEESKMYRSDGSKKSAQGFLGPVKNNVDGGTMTEVSIGVEIDGKEMEIPTMVPGLTQGEIDALADMQIEGNAGNIPESIVKKAEDHARQRITAGKSPFYEDGEELVDEIEALKTQDSSGKVTYQDPKRARELMNQLKKKVGDVEFNKLMNTEGQKQQGDKAAPLIDIDGEDLKYALEWADKNRLQAAGLVAAGVLTWSPIKYVGTQIVRATPRVAKWLTTRPASDRPTLLGKIKSVMGGNKRGASPKSQTESAAAQARQNNQAAANKVFGTKDSPAQGGTAQRAEQFVRNEFKDREFSPTRVAIGAGAVDYLASGDESPTPSETETGQKRVFKFNSDDAVKQAILNEAKDPDSDITKRYLQMKGIGPSNFAEIRNLPTAEQHNAMFAVIMSDPGKTASERMALYEKLNNLMITGSTETTPDRVRQTQNQTLTAQTALRKELRQAQEGGKASVTNMNATLRLGRDISDSLIDESGELTTEKLNFAKTKLTELWGRVNTSTNKSEAAIARQTGLDATLNVMKAIMKDQGAGWNFDDMMDDWFGNDNDISIGSSAEYLRAEVVDGEVSGLYFRDPGTTNRRLDFPISMKKMRGLAGSPLVAELEKIALKNNEDEEAARSES